MNNNDLIYGKLLYFIYLDNNTFIKNIVIMNKNKLNKMTKDEIINYMKELNKNIVTNKKTTKKELIELVLAD